MPETLRQLLNRGRVDPATALDILGQLLNALEFAHWRGIIYGYVAPENILVTSTDEATDEATDEIPGEATLAYFGVPYAGDDYAFVQADRAVDAPGYLAPEQINGDPADERTDIFALGVVAFEMFTGKHPFGASDGLSAGSVRDRILHEAPFAVPQETLSGLPPHIPSVLDVALAKDPDDRFSDATSFLDALKEPAPVVDVIVPDEPPPSSTVTPRAAHPWRKWLIIILLGCLVVAAVVVLWTVDLGPDTGSSGTSTTTSGGATSTGSSATAIVLATTTTSVAPTTTIATTTTTEFTTTTELTTTTTAGAPVRFEQTDSRLVYTGTWNTTTDGSASQGSSSFANSRGSSVTITFEGSYLAWIAKKAPNYGKAMVTLDGRSLGTIDLYSASTVWQQKVWGTGLLEFGPHTVTIAWTGTKNKAATKTNIGVDAFDVVGSLTRAQ